ncbi:RiPP maturation radical SAM C-methyltransferase [Streptomyces sp. NPDC048272]|uniref:RiPP maturation radical SAM C-methyltransferase n=1 Tax=Streptomyces sp. NPDC048272 TaxID=3154616 RepID=UPI00343CA531
MPRIALMTLPFASSTRPSLQLGLLKAVAEREGWAADTFHFNLDFAALIGRRHYEALCQHRGVQLGDWIFANEAFGEASPDRAGEFIDELTFDIAAAVGHTGEGDAQAWLRDVRDRKTPYYLDKLVASVDWNEYDVVGFTCTFQQSVASFALARRLKAAFPHLVTVFGGANFDSGMGLELIASVDSVDVAVIGEGDLPFPMLLKALGDKEALADIPGVAWRQDDGSVSYTETKTPFNDLDSLPMPDYEEYFERAESLGFFKNISRSQVDLPFESARGCWWGEKNHCVFCGLNASGMQFRSKSPERVLREIEWLSSRHRSLRLESVDNILNRSYLSSVIDPLADKNMNFNIFYEMKSNVSPAEVERLADAGVKRIQPGIESLSTPVLKLMRKGVTALQNINLLRWSKFHGIEVGWNLLWGFPGELAEHYSAQVAVLEEIPHLQPPGGDGRLWLERFSPMFMDRATFGVRNVAPLPSYKQVYPANVDLAEVAYFFDYDVAGCLPVETFDATLQVLSSWRTAWEKSDPPALICQFGPGFMKIDERRPGFAHRSYVVDGVHADLYRRCFTKPRSIRAVSREMGHSEESVLEMVADLAGLGLILREDSKILALALPPTGGWRHLSESRT